MNADLWVAAFLFTLSVAAIVVGAIVLLVRALFESAKRDVARQPAAADAAEYPELEWREER